MATHESSAPGSNPKAELRLNKKTFNVVGAALFREIGKIFPNDPKLLFLSQELARFSKNKQKDHVPAMQFFKAMNLPTGLVSSEDPSSIAVVGECVLTHDPRLFSEECPVSIPQLDSVDFKKKWAMLSALNREFVWGYLERMATLSAKIATAISIDAGDIMGLMQAVSQASAEAPAASDPNELMTHPAVAAMAEGIRVKMEALTSPADATK
jgi:hypothetical protein